MLEFRKYGPAPTEEKGAPMCVVTYPEACGEAAVGEVWGLPFCEAHGEEAHAAALLEAYEDAGREFDALMGGFEGEHAVRNPLVYEALKGTKLPEPIPGPDHGEAIRAAYALREGHTDPDTLAFDYAGEVPGDSPYDWHCEAREMVVGFMREAHEAGQPQLLRSLEPLREFETVQQELAREDMERRYVAPRRTAREERRQSEARRDPSAGILGAVNGNLGAAIDGLESLPVGGPFGAEAVREAHQAIAEAGQLVAREQRRVSEGVRPE